MMADGDDRLQSLAKRSEAKRILPNELLVKV